MNDHSSPADPNVRYFSVPLLQLSAEREFPGNVYLCLNHKMVKYRNRGDKLDAESFNKLVFNHVKIVFIEDSDREAFDKWLAEGNSQDQSEALLIAENPEAGPIIEAIQEQRRAMMDIFESPREDGAIKGAIDTSKRMVTEFLRKPFALSNVQALQKYSKGCVDHSVNVSMLCVFLGLKMGYSHQLILENLALGGLFHDLGKTEVSPNADDSPMTGEDDPAMREHPKLGAELIEKRKEFNNEVRMIIAQHHEYLDGTGYPAGLKGLAVYDLARLVGIANVYDNLISESQAPTMKERVSEALDRLESDFEGKFDPKKLEKVIKILRYSFV
ncbi:MAG: HD domain-containing phosphohydrolase [Bdellovibrionota bacterium]